MANIMEKDKKNVSVVLKKLKKNTKVNFELKKVKSSIRNYFCPIALNQNTSILQSRKILLVDDTIATATTLYFAKKLIKQINPIAQIDAISLLSGIHKS